MRWFLLALVSILVFETGCGAFWPSDECGPPIPVDLDKLDGKTFLSNSACNGPLMRTPWGPIEMRIEMDEKRVVISYDARGDYSEVVRVEEVWRFE